MLLPSLITLRRSVSIELQPEDIFGDTLGAIFTDDLQNQHGENGNTVVLYRSGHYGEIELRTADINSEEERRKFAHYLWNAGVLMAELVGARPEQVNREGSTSQRQNVRSDQEFQNGGWWVSREEEKNWTVQGERVLELGAGA